MVFDSPCRTPYSWPGETLPISWQLKVGSVFALTHPTTTDCQKSDMHTHCAFIHNQTFSTVVDGPGVTNIVSDVGATVHIEIDVIDAQACCMHTLDLGDAQVTCTVMSAVDVDHTVSPISLSGNAASDAMYIVSNVLAPLPPTTLTTSVVAPDSHVSAPPRLQTPPPLLSVTTPVSCRRPTARLNFRTLKHRSPRIHVRKRHWLPLMHQGYNQWLRYAHAPVGPPGRHG
jgi:hypothetical protein